MQLTFSSQVVCPTLIGRTAELSALRLLIERAKEGKGGIALLHGEAGVGKSRLVRESKQEALQQGFLVLQGNCFQADHSYPYAPLLDLWRSYFTRIASETYSPSLQQFAQELSWLLPDLASLSSPSLLDPEQEKRRLFAVMSQFVVLQAASQPVLFILEDLHWCDDASLEFLLSLVHRCTDLPLLFILTYRSEEAHDSLEHFLAQLERERLSQSFALARLGRQDVERMLHAIVATPSVVRTIFATPPTLPAGLLETIYTLTEGNPFFVEELLTSLIASGQVSFTHGVWEYARSNETLADHLPLPRSIQTAVQQRTRQLNAEARQCLTFAAVAGRRFNFTVLQEVMQCEEAHLLCLIKELVAARLVVEESAEVFAFRHVLTRQAIYTELLVRERQALHRTLAETIERIYASTPFLELHVMELAYHYTEAEVWSKALSYGRLAGERTLHLYAPRAAVEHFTQALDAASQLKMTGVSTIYQLRGQAYEMLGEFEQARHDYAQALHIAEASQDRLMEWQCLLALGFLWAGRDYTQAGSWFRDALTLASTLADPALQARSLNRLGNWLVNTGQPEEGLQAHREALALFETLEDTQGMAETLDLLGQAHGLHNDLITSVNELGQAIDLFRALNNTQSLVSSLTTCVVYAGPNLAETTLSALLTRDECLRDTTEALNLARRIDSPAGQAYAEFVLGMLLTSFGEFGTALAHAQEALRLATEIQHQQWMAGASFVLGRLSVLLLDAPSAIQTLEAGLVLASHVGSAWWTGNITAYLALAYLLSNEPSRAEALLEASLPRTPRPRTSPERRLFWVRGELALAQGHPDSALDIADTLLITAPGADSTKQPIPWLLKLKGEALVALGRTEEAIAALSEAERGALQRQEQALLWRIHRAAGYAHRHLKREEQAQHHFSSARQGIASLASTIDDSSLHDQFLQAALATLPREKSIAAKRAAKQAFGGLTEREREVVALIAQGKSNREIAEALVVAKITVETHVNNILHKLGFTSRTQIVLWAVERGLAKH